MLVYNWTYRFREEQLIDGCGSLFRTRKFIIPEGLLIRKRNKVRQSEHLLHYSESSLFRRFLNPKVRYSEGSLFRKRNQVRYSEGSLIRLVLK